jgi:two-component system, LytTR family, sensor histidine kinase AlgZ
MNAIKLRAPEALRKNMPVLNAIVCCWIAFCVVQLGASMSDQNSASPDALTVIATRVALSNLPFAIQCLLHYALFRHLHESLSKPSTVAAIFLGSVLVFFLPSLVWQAAINPIILGTHSWDSLPDHFARYPAVYSTVDFLFFCGCFAGSYALCLKQEHVKVAAARATADRENLELRLALEQQRFATLQAQLEPHFLFNALSSISGLIRLGDKRLALAALSQLSMLLRYAVEVSGVKCVSLDREMAFVRDYLALQTLRFDDRLTVDIVGENSKTRECLIPPLLLQPLVENAIRHDLERHTLTTNLRINIEIAGRTLVISISNPVRDEFEPNSGTGFGLRHVADRLEILYGKEANMIVECVDARHVVKLTLPAYGDD